MVTSNFRNFSNFPNGLISATSNSPSIFINLSVWCRLHLLPSKLARELQRTAENCRLMGHLTFPAHRLKYTFHSIKVEFRYKLQKKFAKLLNYWLEKMAIKMATYKHEKTWTEQNKLINFYYKQLITSKNMCSDVSKCRIHNCFHYFSLLITKNWKLTGKVQFLIYFVILPIFCAIFPMFHLILASLYFHFYLRLIIHCGAFLPLFLEINQQSDFCIIIY